MSSTRPVSSSPGEYKSGRSSLFTQLWSSCAEFVQKQCTEVSNLAPHIGRAGSLSSSLYNPDISDAGPPPGENTWNTSQKFLLVFSIFLGTFASTLLAVSGFGSGVFPVVDHSLDRITPLNLLGKMPFSATIVSFIAIALLCISWLILSMFTMLKSPILSFFRHFSAFSGVLSYQPEFITQRTLTRIWILWSIPLLFTPPLFSKDVYSYLAQGKIADQGIDPYSAGPVDILGIDDVLARSVPLLWSHSPAPYGPVALWYGSKIYEVTGENIYLGITLHRIIGLIGIGLALWSIYHLAQRFRINPTTAVWLSVLNPVSILHLTAGVHNEALLIGLMLAGIQCALKGTDKIGIYRSTKSQENSWTLLLTGFFYFILGVFFICMGGTIKVTELLALGFVGVALALEFGKSIKYLFYSALFVMLLTAIDILILSLGSGVGLGWITSQGGATDVLSLLSISTNTGLISSSLSSALGLGDHFDSALALCRILGLIVGIFWIIRMLWASYKERISVLGGLGLAMLMLILFFPVIHAWYFLWAIYPLAASINSLILRRAMLCSSVLLCFTALPRPVYGSGFTILQLIVVGTLLLVTTITLLWYYLQKRKAVSLNYVQSLVRW